MIVKKYNIKLACVLFLLMASSFLNTNDIAFEKEIESLVNQYIESLVTYSNNSNPQDVAVLQLELLDFFEDPGHSHYYDLFDESENDKMEFRTYLTSIEDNYGNNIEINIKELSIDDCVENTGDGEAFVTATFTKEMKYNNQSRTVENILKVNINSKPYRINIIGMPEHFSDPSNCSGQNKSKAKKKDAKSLSKKYIQQGDVFFANKKYLEAKDAYTNAKFYQLDLIEINAKIKKCENLMSVEIFEQKAEVYFSQKQYTLAKEYYTKALTFSGSQSTSISTKIQECDRLFNLDNYNFYKKQGDQYFQKKYYVNAHSSYRTADKYKPNDSYVNQKIKECTLALNKPKSSFASIKKEINDAKQMAKRKKYIEAFRVMDKYKDSGQLDKDAYYIMAMILYKNAKGVQRKMKYSKTQAFNYCRLYMLKAKSKGHQKATHMYDNVFSRKIK